MIFLTAPAIDNSSYQSGSHVIPLTRRQAWPGSEGTVLSALSILQMDTLSNGADVCWLMSVM